MSAWTEEVVTPDGRTRGQLREELIRRLESDEVAQARGTLRDGAAMCCLGVACHLFNPRRWRGRTYGGASGVPPRDVLNAYGFYTETGDHADGEKHGYLTGYNDAGMTFPEIAAELRTGKYWKPEGAALSLASGGAK